MKTHLSLLESNILKGRVIITREIDEFNLKYDDITLNEPVLMFTGRTAYTMDKDEAESILFTYKLMGQDWLSFLNKRFDLGIHFWDLEKMKKGKRITDGYMRIFNMFLSVLKHDKIFVAIHRIEDGIHRNLIAEVVNHLVFCKNVKGVLIYTEKDGWVND